MRSMFVLLSGLRHHLSLIKNTRASASASLLHLALNRKSEGNVERKWAVTPGGLLLLVYCFVSAYLPLMSDKYQITCKKNTVIQLETVMFFKVDVISRVTPKRSRDIFAVLSFLFFTL